MLIFHSFPLEHGDFPMKHGDFSYLCKGLPDGMWYAGIHLPQSWLLYQGLMNVQIVGDFGQHLQIFVGDEVSPF